jgi:hypothetical protein
LCNKSQRWPDSRIRDIDEKTIVRDPVTLKNGEICPDYQHTPGITETNIFLAICQFPGEGFLWGENRQKKEHDCLTDEDNTMLLASANDEKQTQLIKRNAYARKLKDQCKLTFDIYVETDPQYTRMLDGLRPEDFRKVLEKDTVVQKYMSLVMWLIFWELKKKICIYQITYTDFGMRQENEFVKELFFVEKQLYGDGSLSAAKKVSEMGDIKLLYDPNRHYFDKAHVQTSEEIAVSEKSDHDVQWQTLPVPADDLCASTLVRRGEYRAQTGIWRLLSFVSVRTIKGRSSTADSAS